MANTAAHLVDHVIPNVPTRQWVLSLPRRLRFLLAYKPALITQVLSIFVRAVFAYQRLHARRLGIVDGKPGAITFVQRFGSALNLNVHFHALIPDGVFTPGEDGQSQFHALERPSDDEVEAILLKVVRRAIALLEPLHGDEADSSTPDMLIDACANAIDVLPAPVADDDVPAPKRHRSAFADGFSLDASVSVGAGHREALERLCRYGGRPPLALSRLGLDSGRRVTYSLRRRAPGPPPVLSLAPTDFLGRLAALVPPPRMHITRFHGVFAPNAKLRSKVVPSDQISLAGHAVPRPPPARHYRTDWASLLRRVFAVDVLTCTRCGGRMRVLSFITDAAVARHILAHVGLSGSTPPLAPTRGPPQAEFAGWGDDQFVDPPAFDPA